MYMLCIDLSLIRYSRSRRSRAHYPAYLSARRAKCDFIIFVKYTPSLRYLMGPESPKTAVTNDTFGGDFVECVII